MRDREIERYRDIEIKRERERERERESETVITSQVTRLRPGSLQHIYAFFCSLFLFIIHTSYKHVNI